MMAFFKRKLHDLVSDKKFSEILRGSGWAAGAHIIGMGLTLITSVIIVRFYGAEMIGIVAVINSFLILVTIFTVLGTHISILRLIPEHLTKYSVYSAFKVYRKIQYFVAGLSIIIGVIIFFSSSLIADKIFSKPHLSYFFAIASIFVLFKSLMLLNTQAVRGLRLIRTFAFMQLLPHLSMFLILIAVTFLFFNQYNPVYALFASFIVTALVGIFIMDREFKNRIGQNDHIQKMRMKSIVSISAPMFMTATTTFLIGQTGVILLGMFRTEAEVGYYAIAVKLATLVSFLLSAINSMAAPKFSELYHSGKINELFHVAKKSTKLIFWTTAPIFLILVTFGKPILWLLFGQEFTQAYLPLVFLVVGQFVHSISGSTAYFMNMTGNHLILMNIRIITAFINVFLGLILIPEYGIHGAAFVGMLSMSFWNIYVIIKIKSKFGKTIGYFPFVAYAMNRLKK
ncbi:MAG: flippase [Atribacterota bacterium]